MTEEAGSTVNVAIETALGVIIVRLAAKAAPVTTANFLHYVDGAKSYILAPQGLQVGATVESGDKSDIRPGNALPLRFIPTGTVVHNVELVPGQGGKLVLVTSETVDNILSLTRLNGIFSTAPSMDEALQIAGAAV